MNFFLQRWRDYKLAWDPLEYGNITEIRLPQKVVWKPDILMYNRYDMIVSQVIISGELVYMHIEAQYYYVLKEQTYLDTLTVISMYFWRW